MDAQSPFEIDAETLHRTLKADASPVLLDVREAQEVQVCALPGSVHIPMMDLPQSLDRIPEGDLVVVCHHGNRSLQVVAWLRANGFERVVSLRGGLQAWAERIDPSMPTY